jgi:hypothetical protein
VARWMRFASVVQVGVLLIALPVPAQVKLGETTANANGTISSGYSATYGNMTDSTHGWTFGGAGTFAGSYHSPNFLTFNISPYLNQSRANSNFQSISNASGVNATVNLFGGSQFPGSISYSDAYNSDGNYGIPGLANFVTHGNSNTFGINWSENILDAPSFSAGFQTGNSNYDVYGTNDSGKNAFHSVNLHSGYTWEGLHMGAYYTNGGGHSQIPQIVAGAITETQTGTNAWGMNASHVLPLQGSFSAGFNRSSWDTSYLGYNSTGTIDVVNAVAALHPIQSVSMSGTLDYSDNLTGQLIQSVINTGGIVEGLNSNSSSDALDMEGVVTYAPLGSLQTSAFVERRSQSFLGQDYAVNSYGGGATYTHPVFHGNFNGSFMMSANTSNQNGQDTLGFSTTENYTTEVAGWHVNGTFGYAQNAQTLLVTYTNSYYNYSGNVHRNWGYFNIAAGAGGARTALTQVAGTTSSSDTYNGAIGYGPWITANGSYSKSSGQALATGAGLVPVPVPSPILPEGIVSLYGGDAYSASLASTPVRGLIISAGWAKALSNTTTATANTPFLSSNESSQFNSLVQYQYRKMFFTSGYARLQQGFSVVGNQPEIISSYYMGISRWFNFF